MVFTLIIPINLSFADTNIKLEEQEKARNVLESWTHHKNVNELPENTKNKMLNILNSRETLELKETPIGKYIQTENIIIGVSNENEFIMLERLDDNTLLMNGVEEAKMTVEKINKPILKNRVQNRLYLHVVSKEEANDAHGSWEYIGEDKINITLHKKLKKYTTWALSLVLVAYDLSFLAEAVTTIAFNLITDVTVYNQNAVLAYRKTWIKPLYKRHRIHYYGQAVDGDYLDMGIEDLYYGL